MSVLTPATPGLAVVPDSDSARLVCEVSCDINTASDGTQHVQVEFHDGDDEWVPLRNGDGIDAVELVEVYDDEVTARRERWYRARAFQTDDTSTLYSGWSETASGSVAFRSWWLGAPADGLRVRLIVSNQDIDFTRAQPKAEYTIQGQELPFIVKGQRQGLKGSMEYICDTDDSYTELVEVLSATSALIVQCPAGVTFYAEPGDISEKWRADMSFVEAPHRVMTVALTEAKRP
jgi:hypothetical protein